MHFLPWQTVSPHPNGWWTSPLFSCFCQVLARRKVTKTVHLLAISSSDWRISAGPNLSCLILILLDIIKINYYVPNLMLNNYQLSSIKRDTVTHIPTWYTQRHAPRVLGTNLTGVTREWRIGRHPDTHRKSWGWVVCFLSGEAAVPWNLRVFRLCPWTGREGYCS